MIVRKKNRCIQLSIVIVAMIGACTEGDSNDQSLPIQHDDSRPVEASDGSESGVEEVEGDSAASSAATHSRRPEDYPDYQGYLDTTDPLVEPSSSTNPNLGPNQLAVGVNPVEEGSCDGDDDTCVIHYPIRFFKKEFFDDASYTPPIPYSERLGPDGTREWYRANLPADFDNNVDSYNLKDNCGFYHYSKRDQQGHKHGQNLYADQYLATDSVPDFRSFAIRCYDHEPHFATVYDNPNFTGRNFRAWGSFVLDTQAANGLWTDFPDYSVVINVASWPNLAIEVRNTVGKLFDKFFTSRKVIPTSSQLRAMAVVTVNEHTIRCNPTGHCWGFDQSCNGEEHEATSMEACSLFENSSYCTPGDGEQGYCVDPGDGVGITPPH